MNDALLELALRKQRIQIAGEALRDDFGRHAGGLTPAFTGADCAVDAVRYLRRHPEWVVAAGTALIVARPKVAWRWARRAFVGWRVWRKLRDVLDKRLPA